MRFNLKPEDSGYAVMVEGPKLGHVSQDGRTWRLETPVFVEGTAESIEDAQEQMRARYFKELQRLWTR